MKAREMRGLQHLVFSTTNRCTARCLDCPVVHEGGPPSTLTGEQMRGVIDEVMGWGTLRLVVFTGGEPFLLGDELRRTVAHAARYGVFTRIVTNAYWATSRARAEHLLKKYKDAGLTEINISCDDYHQQFVPLRNVKYASEAALDLAFPLLIAHRRVPGSRITTDYLSEFLGVELREFRPAENHDGAGVFLSNHHVPIRARVEGRKLDGCDVDETSWQGPCPVVMREIVISPNRQVEICCGIARSSIQELCIGSLAEESLLSILARGNRDLIVNWLALAGPASIAEFVRSKEPMIDLPNAYVNRCHLCNELFTRDDVRRILRACAPERGEMVALMRGILDWVSEEWVRSMNP